MMGSGQHQAHLLKGRPLSARLIPQQEAQAKGAVLGTGSSKEAETRWGRASHSLSSKRSHHLPDQRPWAVPPVLPPLPYRLGSSVRQLLHSSSGSVRNFVMRYVRSEGDPLEILDPNLAASVAFDRWVRLRMRCWTTGDKEGE